MKTVRAHLQAVHKMTSDDVANMSEAHARLAGYALKCAKALRDGDSSGSASALEDFAREFSARAATEQRLAKFLSDLSDELDDGISQDLQDMSGATPRAGLVNENDKAAKIDDGLNRFSKLVPDNVRGITPERPQITAVPRPGGPPIEGPNVDPAFQHLVETNEPL